MKKKCLAIFVAICMVVQLLPAMPVLATTTPATEPSEVVSSAPKGYAETGTDITVSSAEGLVWLAQKVNRGDFEGEALTVTLADSLDMSAHAWVPIGTAEHPFNGTFDGQGYRISGLHMTVDDSHLRAGLFGEVGALTINNLHLSDLTVTGTVQGVADPSTNDHRFTDLRIGGIVATQADRTASDVTVSDCQVEMQASVTTTDGVYATIGGIIGRTNDNEASRLAVSGTKVQLDSATHAPQGFYYALTGGCVGEVNTTAASAVTVRDSHFTLASSASCTKSGIAKAVCTGGVIGKSDRLSTDQATNVITLSGVTAEGTHDFSATTGILATPPAAIAEIGGFFGDAQGIVMTDCYASAALTANEAAERFGNVAGYIQNAKLIDAKNVYTYGVVKEGNATLVNKRATHDISNATFAEACPSVYFVEPQTLTEGVAGVPFVYKSFASPSVQASDTFTYSDGDASDAATVTPAENGKQVAIRPAAKAVPVSAQGAGIAFTLPVTVNPAGAVFYHIKTTPSRWGVEITTDKPNNQAQSGEVITVTVSHWPTMKAQKLTITPKDASIKAPVATLIDKQEQQATFQFTMPASDVEIRDTLTWKEHSVRLTPSSLDFGLATEGGKVPAAQSVTIKNNGDYDEDLDIQVPAEYTVTRGEDTWSAPGLKGTLKKGDSLTLLIQPKQGLAPKKYRTNIALQAGYSSLAKIRCSFEVVKPQKYLLVASDNYPTLGKVDEGYLSNDATATVTLTNLGTEALDVTLPAFEYFLASFSESEVKTSLTLQSQETATVTLHPKEGLVSGQGPEKDDYYYEFRDLTTNHPEATVTLAPQIVVQQSPTIVFKPTDTSAYSEGLGYDGVILEDGTVVEQDHGFAEPGFFVDLPQELKGQLKAVPNSAIGTTGQHNLSGSIVLRYSRPGLDAPRLWDLALYGQDEHSITVNDPDTGRYVYRAVSTDGTPSPLRLQVLDQYNIPLADDSFTPTLDTTQHTYTTVIPTQEDGTLSAIVTLKDGTRRTCKVKLDTSQVQSKGLTKSVRFTKVLGLPDTTPTAAASLPETSGALAPCYAVAPSDTLLFMNGLGGISEVAVKNTGGVHLLNDVVLDQDILPAYIQKNMALSGDAYDQKYLDVVDFHNGNAVLSPNKPLTIYWPVPADFDAGKPFTMVHFDLLKRTNENVAAELEQNKPEICPATLTSHNGKQYVTFEATSFSPYVLVYSKASQGEITPPAPQPPTPQPPTPPAEKPQVADPSDTGVAEWLDTVHHAAYLQGVGNGLFLPDSAMTRAEVAQMFYNLLLDKSVTVTTTFSDVPEDAWYGRAVNTLASLGILNGIGNDTFAPNRAITRAEFTAIAMRFGKLDTTGTNIFSDVATSDWFYNDIVGAIKYGWIGGYPDGTFRPHATITRAEVTSITNRMLARCADRTYADAHSADFLCFTDVTPSHWAYYDITEATNSHDYERKENGSEYWTALNNG